MSDGKLTRFLTGVEPEFKSLYCLAYAITGNDASAEYALQSGLLRAYEEDSSDSFRVHLYRTVRAEALARALTENPGELTFEAFSGSVEATDDALLRRIEGETAEFRRILVLKYGCGLSCKEIAELLNGDAREIRRRVYRFTVRAGMDGVIAGKSADSMLAAVVHREMNRTTGEPDLRTMMRSIELDVKTEPAKRPVGRKILRTCLVAVGALLCAALLWLLAVLVHVEPASSHVTAAVEMGDFGAQGDGQVQGE